ncbi:MAG: hypothetical protein AB7V58_19255, partial [Solirubrobacterales bacterium]
MVRCKLPTARSIAPVLIVAALLVFAAGADAARPGAGGTAAPGQGKGAATEERGKGNEVAGPPAPAPSATAAAGKELGAGGQVDPLSGLGIGNPVCDRVTEIRDRRTRLSCEANGTPESIYPASNYGFDIFIDTGVDAPTGTFTKGFVMILNGLWLGLIFVLKLVLALLG